MAAATAMKVGASVGVTPKTKAASVRDAAAAPAAPTGPGAEAARRAEIEAIRQEIALRRARLDSIAGRVQQMGAPATPRDTTRRP